MTTFGLLGATGFTGRLVAAELARQGHPTVLAGRDPASVRAAAPAGLQIVDVVRADVTQPATLAPLLAAADVLLSTVGPFMQLGQPVVEAAVAAEVPLVDSAGEQEYLAWVHQTQDAQARAARVSLLPAAGFDFVPGDLLTAVAAHGAEGADEVHVAYGLPRRSDLLLGWSRGTRASMAGLLGGSMRARVDGQLIEEPPAAIRRLAWFPRPVGPHHAIGIPGGEALSVPLHQPQLRTVRTYLAVPSLAAELLQASASVARWSDTARRALGWMLTAPGDPSEVRRAGTRWACVAELHASAGVTRAWAYGTDLYQLTAVAMVVLGERLAAGGAPAGVVVPAQLAPAPELLDELGARSDLRWSVSRP